MGPNFVYDVGLASLAKCRLGSCSTINIIPRVDPGTGLVTSQWTTWCAGTTPQKCPNGQDISNLQHLECEADTPYNWACVAGTSSFSTYPIPTYWGTVGALP